MNYIVAVVENPFEYDTMQKGQVYGLQQERQTAEQADEQESGEETPEGN